MPTAIGQYLLGCGQCGYVLAQAEPKYDSQGNRLSVPQAFVKCMNSRCENYGKTYKAPYVEIELVEEINTP